MNKLKMAAVQERLKLKRVQIDTWTAKEKLCLASAVLRSGDQNWVSVSRTLRSFDELNRPPDWFSQKNCALQYSSLLEKVDTPKRKRGERGEVHVETPGECIVRKLTTERMEELKNSLATKKLLHRKLLEEIALIQAGLADDRLDEMLEEIEEEKLQKKREEEIHAQWLKEREEKLLEIKRAWKPPAASSASVTASSHQQRDPESRTQQSSSQSEQSSEAESLVDSPLSEPLQVDVIGDESLEEQVETKPTSPVRESSPQPNPSVALVPSTPSTPTPTSPLLTSLLKSPSQAPSSQASSILHSAITAQRGSSPTITSLLNSSPAVPVSGAVSPTVSGGIKNLATAAFNNASSEDNLEKNQPSAPATLSPSAGAPTLSMLLELPPSLPGKPLPEIPSLTPKVPSTVKKESASPIPSPPASPLPSQSPSSDPPEIHVPKKEEETEKDITVPAEEPTVPSDEQEKHLESNKKIEQEEEKGLEESTSAKSEKIDIVAEVSVLENTPASISDPEPSTGVEEKNPKGPEVLKTGSEDKNYEELPSTIPVRSDPVEESVKTDEVNKEAEPELTTEKTSSVDILQKKLPEEVEVQENINNEAKTEEVSDEKSTVDEAEVTEKNVNKDVTPVEEVSDSQELLPITNEENIEKLQEIVTENPSVDEVENKSETDDVPKKTDEVEKENVKEEKQPSAISELNEEPSVPEPSKVFKKDEGTSESAVDEEEIEDKIRNNESLLSTPESLTPDSQIKRRGGGRGRKFRGRALAMYRMRQEKIAKAQLEKEKDSSSKALESESEASAKETVSVGALADEKDKSEAKKVKPVEDEISNLKSEWNEEVSEEAKEEEKNESGTSLKKTKGKKVEENNDDSEKKSDDSKTPEKAKIEDKTSTKVEGETKETIRKKVEKEVKVSEDSREPLGKTANEGEKLLSEGKIDLEKKMTESKTADEPLVKSQEKKKGKEETVEIEVCEDKKPSVEKKIDEKKTSEKKPEFKSKQIPSEKKPDDKDRKKTKENRVERKDKKVDEEKKVEDPKAKKEEESTPKEDEKKIGKERKSDVRDKKGLSEKRSEVAERKPVRERKSEEKEEKSSGERRNVDKAKKEPEAKKIEGERKLSRDRKSEEKEKKSTSEKKMEDVRKKSVDEKKTEETEKVKQPEKEVTASTKKSVSAHTPEKSKTPAVTPSTCGAMAEKLKRKLDSMDESLGASEKPSSQEEKKAKRSEEIISVRVSESDKEMNESERKVEEDSAVKRKMDRRKGNLSRRLEVEESANKGTQNISTAEEKERINEGESTPKSNIGRRRGAGSLSIASTPGTPLDQVPHSPASSMSVSEEERDYRAWKKAILLVWSRLATHKFASIFLRPITNDQAPGYHNVVFRPVDLYTIKKNVENGVIRTTAHFQRDVMLMFLNAIMYNSSDHDVHRMSVQMQQESLQHIQILLEASEAPKILRRETREGNKRSDSSSQMHFTPSASHDDASTAGVSALPSSTHTPGISSVSAVPSSSNSVSSSSLVESSSVTDVKVGGINREVGPLTAIEKEATPVSSKRKRTSAIGALQQGEERAAKKQRFHRSSAAAENIPINSSEEEMSDSESQLSYIMTQHKVGDPGDFSGESAAMQSQFQKDLQDEHSKKKKLEQERFLELKENIDAVVDEDYSAENSNSSDNEDEKINLTQSMSETPYNSKKAVIKQAKDVTNSTAASCGLDSCPDADVGDEQLSSSQYEDHDHFVDEMDKKQMRRLKRSINEILSSSEDSSSIPDDNGYWPNVMSIKEEKNDDTESVTSSVYKRRRIQRKSTNSDPDSLTEAPTFPFSPNSASLEESDYQAWKRLILLIWDQLADHEYATIFMTPVRTDEAPRYYNVVYSFPDDRTEGIIINHFPQNCIHLARPMDLGTIRKNVEKGLVRTISHFQRDVMLMFENALMYNPSHHDVHHKTAQMQKDCLQYFQVLEQESCEDPEVFRHEIRESNNKIHSTGLDDITTVTSKSDSSSSEDHHLTYVQASGNFSLTADSVKCSPLKEKQSMVNEKHDGNYIGKKSASDAKSSPAFSTRKRTSTFDTK